MSSTQQSEYVRIDQNGQTHPCGVRREPAIIEGRHDKFNGEPVVVVKGANWVTAYKGWAIKPPNSGIVVIPRKKLRTMATYLAANKGECVVERALWE